jgi:hypothetical protein
VTTGEVIVRAPADAITALQDLRRTRQRRRLGDLDWYEIAYRVYLFGLVGLAVVVWLSEAIDGVVGDTVDTDDLLARGPAAIGLIVVVAFALGVRSGADGGPISIELADIRHVLLAPVDRRRVMLRPIGQRLRACAFTVGLAGAIVGQLIGTEVEGSRAAWAAACGAFGAVVGATFVSAGVFSHALRVPRWAATAIAVVVVAWQAAVAWSVWHGTTGGPAGFGPGTPAGELALSGVEQRIGDVIAVAVAVAMAVAALALGGRLRIEALARRGDLVSQLRFAATMQDLRTVVLLRRQLRSEVTRSRMWGQRRAPSRPAPRPLDRSRPHPSANTRPPRPSVVWRRGGRSLRRLPAARVVRIVLLAGLAGVGGALTYASSPLFGLVMLGALFLVGLESLEPLSQEVDRPDLTDSLPIDRGWIYANHLAAPAVLLIGAAVIAAGAGAAVEPSAWIGAFAMAVPCVWAGASGGIVTTMLDAPAAPTATTLFGNPRNGDMNLMPPEITGFNTAIKALLPGVMSAVGTAPVYVARLTDDAGSVVRSVVATLLFVAAVVIWVRRRDEWGTKIREFFEEGRAASR